MSRFATDARGQIKPRPSFHRVDQVVGMSYGQIDQRPSAAPAPSLR